MHLSHVVGDPVHEYRVVHLLKAIVKVFEVQKPHVGADVDAVRAVCETRPVQPAGLLRRRTTVVPQLHKHSVFEKVIVERAVHALVAEQQVRRRQVVVRVSSDVGSVRREVPELQQTVVVQRADEGNATGMH